MIVSDNVDYANKLVLSSTGIISKNKTGITATLNKRLCTSDSRNSCKNGKGTGKVDFVYYTNSFNISILDPSHNHTINITTKNSSNNSNNETRVRSKFFSLLIYAGYPMQ